MKIKNISFIYRKYKQTGNIEIKREVKTGRPEKINQNIQIESKWSHLKEYLPIFRNLKQTLRFVMNISLIYSPALCNIYKKV